MSLRSIVLLSFLFCMLQGGHFVGSESCAVEGSIRLDPQDSGRNINSKKYYLLQVCLFEQWSYVCSDQFDSADRSVALHQLGSTYGYSTGGDSSTRIVGKWPVFLTNLHCSGVETKLINCPRGSPLTRYICWNKIQVYINNESRLCENGELKKNSNNVLRICVNAEWRTLCPMLWGPPQAIVACRQLNPGKLIIGSVTKSVQGTPSFKYHFFCNGNEKQITDCVVGDYAVDTNICGNSMMTALMCQISYVANLTLRAISSSSVEVNWTQPVSVPPQYRVSNHSITCTSSHGVYTTTSQHVTTPSVNESTHIHMIISGLMSNTSYTCCVSAHRSELGSSESVCDTVITREMMSNVPTQKVESSPASWVGGIIIGAVLSTVILLTVLATVCLWRRKRSHSQHNTSVVGEKERTASFSHTDDIHNAAYSLTSPQPYEECQLKQSNEPEYSYATPHTTSTPQQSNSNVMGLPVVDNTVLYSMCEEGVQEKKEYVYSEINRK